MPSLSPTKEAAESLGLTNFHNSALGNGRQYSSFARHPPWWYPSQYPLLRSGRVEKSEVSRSGIFMLQGDSHVKYCG